MKIIKEEHCADPRAIDYIPPGAVFLDIETTGLKKETDMIILIGCSWLEEGSLQLIQWFNDDAVSEETMLSDLLAFLEDRSGPLITFNGDRFDLPFLKAHFNYNGMSSDPRFHPILDGFDSLDLYRRLHCFSPLLSMEHSTQKAWEIHLGIHREDQMNGGQIISLYKEYLRTKDPDLSGLILLHNRDDILHLASLPSLLAYEQLRKEDLMPASMEESRSEGTEFLSFTFDIRDKGIFAPLHTESEAGIVEIEPGSGKIFLHIPCIRTRMYYYYPDYKNYVYLPAEDRAIHKSVGIYVDRDHREKASPQTAYMSVDSIFLPLPRLRSAHGFSTDINSSLPRYRRKYDDCREFLNLDDLLREKDFSGEWKTYLNAMIHEIFLDKIREEKRKKQNRRKRK